MPSQVPAGELLNIIDPPPRHTGDPASDTASTIQWMWSFFAKGVLAGGLVQVDNLYPEMEPWLEQEQHVLFSLSLQDGGPDQIPYYTDVSAFSTTPFTPFARTLVDDPDAASARATLYAVSPAEVAAAIAAHEAAPDPHTPYSLVDGTRDFTGTVGGVDPVVDTDFVTKQYLETAIATFTYVPDSLTVNTGTVDAGDVTSLQGLSDGNTLDISEVAATPGFDFIADFTGITELPQRAQIHVHYDGSAGHTIELQIWDWIALAWDTLTTIPTSRDLVFIEIPIGTPVDYVNGSGEARLRVNHISGGNASHNIFTDYMALVKLGFGATTDHGALVGLDDDDHGIYLNNARIVTNPILALMMAGS